MPSILDPEIATRYPALDSDVPSNDGDAAHAHMLRAIGMGSNRMLSKGEPVLQLVWPSSGATEDDKFLQRGYVFWPRWRKVTWGPIIVPKKSTTQTLEIEVVGKVESDMSVWLQICTSVAAFDPNIHLDSDPRVIRLQDGAGTASGSFEIWTGDGIPVGPRPFESIELYATGQLGPNLVSEATYGANNAGSVTTLSAIQFADATSTWNTSGTTLADGSAAVVFLLGGDRVTEPRIITSVINNGRIEFAPAISEAQRAVLLDSALSSTLSYEIYKASSYRLTNVALYGHQRRR